jgi:hypothetical protein
VLDLQEERVAPVLNDTWEWLYRAEEARKAAEQLTDPDAKQCMLQLGRYYDGLARAVIAQARPQEGNFALVGPLGLSKLI